jgi:hypothetical protein
LACFNFVHTKHSLSEIYFITETKSRPSKQGTAKFPWFHPIYAGPEHNPASHGRPVTGAPVVLARKSASHALKGGIPSACPGALSANAPPLCGDKLRKDFLINALKPYLYLL